MKIGRTLIKISGLVDNEELYKKIALGDEVTIVRGASKEINEIYKKHKIVSEFDGDGDRIVPDRDVMTEIEHAVHKIIQDTLNRLNKYKDGKFSPIYFPVRAERKNNTYTGRVTEVIKSYNNFSNKVLGCLGTTGRELVSCNADNVAKEIALLEEDGRRYEEIIYITKDKNSKGMEKKEAIRKELENLGLNMKIMDEEEFLAYEGV